MPSGWSTGASYGPRQPTARWRSRRRSWPTCSTASIGGTRDILGDRRPPAELRQVDSGACRSGTLPPGFDSISGVNSPAPLLPTELAEAHALILQQREELADAEARASGAAAMIAHLKLVIAKLRRDQYGQSAERGRKLLDQLELQLEELEAEASERSVIAERDTSVQAFARRRPVRAPLPAHLPRERVVVPAPCACPVCGGKLAKLGEDITETLEVVPRQWKVIQTVREKFTCRSCERITQPPAPFHVIARARAGASLLAMILYAKFGHHQPPAALFFYSRDRGGEHPRRHLAGWTGILQADAYAGFGELYEAKRRPAPIIEASCWSHGRRKFFELADLRKAPLAIEAVRYI